MKCPISPPKKVYSLLYMKNKLYTFLGGDYGNIRIYVNVRKVRDISNVAEPLYVTDI